MKENNVKIPSSKKNFYKKFFSKQNQVKWWCNIYQEGDIEYGVQLRLKQTVEWISENETLKRNGILLDLGCGTGVTSYALQKLCNKIVGIDQAFSMAEKAKLSFSSAKIPLDFLQGDVEALPFKTDSADFVVCLGVISYLESGQKAILEIARVLKPRGVVILSFHRELILREYLLSLYKNVKCLFPLNSSGNHQFRRQRYSLETISRLFQKSKLKLIETKVLDYNYLTISWRKLISTRLAMSLNRYLLKRSHKAPFNRLGDMYLVKAEKADRMNNKN